MMWDIMGPHGRQWHMGSTRLNFRYGEGDSQHPTPGIGVQERRGLLNTTNVPEDCADRTGCPRARSASAGGDSLACHARARGDPETPPRAFPSLASDGDLIDPTISVHHCRVVKRTGDGSIVEFRVGIHLGDVVEESDGDLMGDGVNIAARLEGVCQPGAICLSEDAYRQVKGRLDLAVTDLGPTRLKNIAEPIRVYSLQVGVAEAKPALHTPASQKHGPPHLSIVVLPFANIGGDPEQEHFVDGVTESLTTDLSRISGSFVIARNTAFTYKGKPFDVKQIGRELNVRYLLEGSVQRGGNHMRVTVQLVDAESGNHLWAERFDKPLADLFEMQDEIVRALPINWGRNWRRRKRAAPHGRRIPNSMDLYFQGLSWVNKGWSPELLAQARDLFERALELDPGNVEALVGKANVDMIVGAAALTDDRAARLAAYEAAAARALSLAPSHVFARYDLGSVQIHTGRVAQGIAQNEHALSLDRGFAMSHANIGAGKLYLGRAEETEAHILEALRLSPRDTTTFVWLAVAGNAKLHLGRDEEAVAWLRRSIDANRNYPLAHFRLAAALAQLGRLDEARIAAQAGFALDPNFTLRRIRVVGLSDNPTYLAQRERVLAGMQMARVPEG